MPAGPARAHTGRRRRGGHGRRPPRRARARRGRSRRGASGTPRRRAMRRAGSRLHPHLLEREAQAAEGVGDPALHGAEREAGLLGDLAQAKALEVRQLDDLAVLRRQAPQGRRHLPAKEGALDRLLPNTLVELTGLDREARADGATALEVDDGVAGDAVEPGPEAGARVVEGVGVSPDAGEDVLHEPLGEAAGAEGVEGGPVEIARVRSVEGAHGVFASILLEALEQGGGHCQPRYTAGAEGRFERRFSSWTRRRFRG